MSKELLYKKEVDKSFVYFGLTLPTEVVDKIGPLLGLDSIARGQEYNLTISICGKEFTIPLSHQKFDDAKYSGHAEMWRVLWGGNFSDIRLLLKQLFPLPFAFYEGVDVVLRNVAVLEETLKKNSAKRPKLPKECAETACFYFDPSNPNVWYIEKERKSENLLPLPASLADEPRQKIVYGAPGTGKSHLVKGKTSGCLTIRTTFHPDSDYSTFVGSYKPTKEDGRITYAFRPQAFMEAYVAAWKETIKGSGGISRKDAAKYPSSGLNAIMVKTVEAFIAEHGKGVEKTRKEIVDRAMEISGGEYDEKSFMPSDYCYNRVNGAMPLIRPAFFEFLGNAKYKCLGFGDTTYTGDIIWAGKYSDEEKIVGRCTNGVRELFAEEPGKPVILVIEEINRGNCAQIFGDLFQLLDREDSGYSCYPINADVDLRTWLAEGDQFGPDGLSGLACPDCVNDKDWKDVLKGKKLMLPPNLYIWATMNTSDQSLFPVDSAFKRRWAWQYVPIRDEGKGIKISIGDESYDWWTFLDKINAVIGDATHSEDKKLGYYFAKAKNGVVDVDTFAGKVLFYLWNDVFKVYGFDNKCFKIKEGDRERVLAIGDFFLPDGNSNSENVKLFLSNLGVETLPK